jgi:uncharacterized protein (DUF1330 family)
MLWFMREPMHGGSQAALRQIEGFFTLSLCREIVDQGELNTYWQRVNETLVSHKARVLMDHGRFLILEGQGPVDGVTVYELPTSEPMA